MDVRIGVTQAPREINIELADDADRAEVKSKVEAALSGAVDVLWLADKKGRQSSRHSWRQIVVHQQLQ